MAAAREKDEWRFATMEYGEQCAQIMVGIKWMLTWSANSWVSAIKELCQPMIAVLEMEKVQYYWKMSHAINNTLTYLSAWTLGL